MKEIRSHKDTEVKTLSLDLVEKEKQILNLIKQKEKTKLLWTRLEEEKKSLTEEMTQKMEVKVAQFSESEKLITQQLGNKNIEIDGAQKQISELQLSIKQALLERESSDQQSKDVQEILKKQLIKEDLLNKEVNRLEMRTKQLESERLLTSETLKEKENGIVDAKQQTNKLIEQLKELKNRKK